MHAPEIPPIEDSLTELDREMEEHLGESALTLFEALARPVTEIRMGKGDITGGTYDSDMGPKYPPAMDPVDVEGEPEEE